MSSSDSLFENTGSDKEMFEDVEHEDPDLFEMMRDTEGKELFNTESQKDEENYLDTM